MSYLYLIKRGPRPEHHNAPFHPVVLCDRKTIAEQERGSSSDGADVWVRFSDRRGGDGWLLTRWRGLDIDYGHVVHGFELPDGTRSGFWRHYQTQDGKGMIKGLLAGAVWWSVRVLPDWLRGLGVVYPADDFTQQTILDAEAFYKNPEGGVSGAGRKIPPFWPVDPNAPARDGRATAALEGLVGEAAGAVRRAGENMEITEEGGRFRIEVVDPPPDTSH